MNYQVSTNYVCGIDLHARTMSICVMDLSGAILKKKNIACIFDKLLEAIQPWTPDITIGVESTYNWYWLIDALTKYNIPCCLGHALYIKKRMGSKHKNDKVDARGLADLLRSNQFPRAYSYPKEMRTTRDLLRRRHFFVRKRASTFTHFQICLHQDGCIESVRRKLMAKSTRYDLVNLTSNKDLQLILNSDLEYIAALDTMIDSLEKTIAKKARIHNRHYFDSLQTIPGCGTTTALTVLYEIHTIDRFRSPQCFSSYSRVVRAENKSAGKNLGGSTNDKIGNPYLKWAISEIGQSMIRNCPEVHRWFAELVKKHGKANSHARLRHKIAVTIYVMLKHGRAFDLNQFLGTKNDQAKNPAQNWTETSGQSSDPILNAEHSSGHLIHQ